MKLLRVACLVALALSMTAGLRASDVQIWHWWTNEITFSEKVVVVWHAQFRTTRPLGEFLQGRTGPIFRYYIAPKTSIAAGYYYRREPNRTSPGWGDSHRFFGGIEDYRYIDSKGVLPASLLESRFLIERFQGGPEGTLTDYTRFRQRNRFSFRDWKVSPLIGYEFFYFPDQWWGHRPHAGVRWKVNERVMLDAAYLWDRRTQRAGVTHHLFFTNLLVRFKKDPEAEYPNRPPF